VVALESVAWPEFPQNLGRCEAVVQLAREQGLIYLNGEFMPIEKGNDLGARSRLHLRDGVSS